VIGHPPVVYEDSVPHNVPYEAGWLGGNHERGRPAYHDRKPGLS
jgi:hypothetical protein